MRVVLDIHEMGALFSSLYYARQNHDWHQIAVPLNVNIQMALSSESSSLPGIYMKSTGFVVRDQFVLLRGWTRDDS
jgi:hypothetical protein